MKNLKRIIVLALALCLFTPSFSTINAKSDIQEAVEITEVEKFNNIQDQITKSLSVNDDAHYVYDKEYVSNLLKTINFKQLNEELGTSYTLDTLRKSIYSDLDTFIVKPEIQTRGTYYNRNYVTEGWNYNRWFTSESKTKQWIKELRSPAGFWASVGLSCLATIPGFHVLGVLGTLGSLADKWDKSFAAALEKKNRAGGVVADVNKYTAVYTITAQVNWYA